MGGLGALAVLGVAGSMGVMGGLGRTGVVAEGGALDEEGTGVPGKCGFFSASRSFLMGGGRPAAMAWSCW